MESYTGKTIILKHPYRFKKQLGEGGFGQVYRVLDTNDNEYAIKVIKSQSEGIPCLTEASIMCTYKHPYINSAIDVAIMEDTLYIIQEVAICDLYDWVKRVKPQRNSVVRLINQVTQGLNFLHREGIIHGDIKTSNILVFPNRVQRSSESRSRSTSSGSEDNSSNTSITANTNASDDVPFSQFDGGDVIFKLTDYNLSSHKSWQKTASVCTHSYRPLEAWEGAWDETVDIWCLGAVIYYAYYHEHIFRNQKTREEERDHEAFINALYDWEVTYYRNRTQRTLPPARKYYDVKYHAPNVKQDLFTKNNDINAVILACMHPKKDNRPNAEQILKSPLLQDYKIDKGAIARLSPLRVVDSRRAPKLVPMPVGIVSDVIYPIQMPETNKKTSTNKIKTNGMSYISAKIANSIYLRYEPYITDDIEDVIETISVMAMKITREDKHLNLKKIDDTDRLFRIERDICRKLEFILF